MDKWCSLLALQRNTEVLTHFTPQIFQFNLMTHGTGSNFVCQLHRGALILQESFLQRSRHRSVLETPSERKHREEQEKAPQIYHGAKTVNERPQAVARQHCPYHSRKWSQTRTLITFSSVSVRVTVLQWTGQTGFTLSSISTDSYLYFLAFQVKPSDKEMSPAGK